MRLASALLLSVAATAACSNRVGDNQVGPCDGLDPAPTCAQACDPVSEPCPAGYYCDADGTCQADCFTDGTGCPDDQFCGPLGQCEARVDADCPSVTLTAERTTPTIELVIDQSGSMDADFGGGLTRWEAMRRALVDATTGVVTTSASSVYFGATLYTGGNTCPALRSVPRALGNLAPIRDLLDANNPAGDTPTGESLDAVVDDFAANPPPPDSPPFILLVTDGEPDTCAQPDRNEGQPESLAAATAAYAAGVRLFVLSVGSDVGAQHLQDMANAGVGNDPAVSGTNAPYYVANDPAQLSEKLQQLIGGVLSCELQLDGSIDPGAAASGVVTLDGVPLQLGVGWEVVDGDTIRLIGEACADLQASTMPVVDATFPCGVVVE
jgi:hypothetical protein